MEGPPCEAAGWGTLTGAVQRRRARPRGSRRGGDRGVRAFGGAATRGVPGTAGLDALERLAGGGGEQRLGPVHRPDPRPDGGRPGGAALRAGAVWVSLAPTVLQPPRRGDRGWF